jgi:hypothetical protein
MHNPYDFAEFGIFSHIEVRAGLNFGHLLGDGAQLFRILGKFFATPAAIWLTVLGVVLIPRLRKSS